MGDFKVFQGFLIKKSFNHFIGFNVPIVFEILGCLKNRQWFPFLVASLAALVDLNSPLFLCTTFAKSSAGSRPFSSPAQRITPLADWKNSKPARKWRKLTNFSSSCCEEKQEGFEKVPTKIDFLTLYACVVFLLFSRLSLILSNYRN